MIKAEHVSKSFEKRKFFSKETIDVLDDLSFEIEKGHTVGLLGKNGSGKTTLIRMLSTLYKPSKGKILIDGFDTQLQPTQVKKRIGVLFGSDVGLYANLTAYDNIMYFARLNDVDETVAKERIESLAEYFKIKDYLYRPVDNFSRGMIQKISFIRAIVHDPEILILDEPSTGLDVQAIEQVSSFIRLNQEKKKTILISSHNLNEVYALSDDLLVIKDKKLAFFGDKTKIDAFSDFAQLKQYMGVE